MKTVIIGAGMTGTLLASLLVQEKHDVVLIEQNEEKARHASNRLDCMVIHNEGNKLEVLDGAGIEKADALVCLTGSDEMNIIICGLAAKRNPSLLTIARVRNADYLDSGTGKDGASSLPGVSWFVHPDIEAANAVLLSIEHGAHGEVLSFGEAQWKMASFDLDKDSMLLEHSVREFHQMLSADMLVTSIERENRFIIPTGDTLLLNGDHVFVLAKKDVLPEIFKLANRDVVDIKKIGIVGGGRIGTLVTEGLMETFKKPKAAIGKLLSFLGVSRSSSRVVIIEKDPNRCRELASRFPEVLVLNEDISDEGFIGEDGIADLDLIVTTTENQEFNIITALYLKSRGVKKVVSLVSGGGYSAISRRLGVDVVVPMKSVLVDSILSRLMGRNISSVHRMGDGTAEILELIISDKSPVLGQRLDGVKLDSAMLLMLVRRGEIAFIPRGDYVFSVDDRVVCIVERDGAERAQQLTGKSS